MLKLEKGKGRWTLLRDAIINASKVAAIAGARASPPSASRLSTSSTLSPSYMRTPVPARLQPVQLLSAVPFLLSLRQRWQILKNIDYLAA